MSAYLFTTGITTNSAARVTSLLDRIPANLEIFQVLQSVTENSGSYTITFDNPLSLLEYRALDNVINCIVFDQIPLDLYPGPRIIESSKRPTAYSDLKNTYNIGCITVHLQEKSAWICVDNTLGAAIWKQISFPTGLINGESLTYNSSTDLWETNPTEVGRSLTYSFWNGNPWITISGASYMATTYFPYRPEMGTPVRLMVVYRAPSKVVNFSVRLVNHNTGQVLAQIDLSNVTSPLPTLIQSTSFSNIPSSDCILRFDAGAINSNSWLLYSVTLNLE